MADPLVHSLWISLCNACATKGFSVTAPLDTAAWDKFLGFLRSSLEPKDYSLWIEPLELVSSDGQTLVAQVPNRFFLEWVNDRYRQTIQHAQKEVGVTIELRSAEKRGRSARSRSDESTRGRTSPADAVDPNLPEQHPQLNPRYTFDAFVPGPSNEFAHAAALAVVERPGYRYNPLVIYGGVGLGKTHLLHAIGHALYARDRGIRINYVSSEKFMNDVVNAIRFDKTADLHRRYRSQCDLLLVDDIQFLAGKERTQTEFFHVFNALHELGKQIVLISDRPPREIPSLEDRLRSRFEQGLLVDVQPPELEHRLAILQRKAADLGLRLSDDVLHFLATYVQSNVRELEGALTRLSAKAAFEGRAVDVDFTRRVLGDLLDMVAPGISADRIQKVVAELFQLRTTDLRGKSRKQSVAYPRQIAMYLCRELTNLSLPEIGQRFGGKDHSTVLHSVRKIAALKAADPELAALLDSLVRTLQRGG